MNRYKDKIRCKCGAEIIIDKTQPMTYCPICFREYVTWNEEEKIHGTERDGLTD